MKVIKDEKGIVGKTVVAIKHLELPDQDVIEHAVAFLFEGGSVVFLQGDDPYDSMSIVDSDCQVERCLKELKPK